MVKQTKILSVGLIAIAILILTAMIPSASTVNANPIYVGATAQTATATSSPAFIGVGTATSTVTYDAYASTTLQYVPTMASLLVQFTASSTSSVLAINLQYSNDGIDWYQDSVYGALGHGTSTQAIDLATTNSITWKAAGTAVTNRIIMIPTPTRYVRVISSLTGAAGAVWVQVAPIKEKI